MCLFKGYFRRVFKNNLRKRKNIFRFLSFFLLDPPKMPFKTSIKEPVETKNVPPLKNVFGICLLYITLNITLKCFGNLFLGVIVFCLQFVWREDELHYIKKLARELNLITSHQKNTFKKVSGIENVIIYVGTVSSRGYLCACFKGYFRRVF